MPEQLAPQGKPVDWYKMVIAFSLIVIVSVGAMVVVVWLNDSFTKAQYFDHFKPYIEQLNKCPSLAQASCDCGFGYLT